MLSILITTATLVGFSIAAMFKEHNDLRNVKFQKIVYLDPQSADDILNIIFNIQQEYQIGCLNITIANINITNDMVKSLNDSLLNSELSEVDVTIINPKLCIDNSMYNAHVDNKVINYDMRILPNGNIGCQKLAAEWFNMPKCWHEFADDIAAITANDFDTKTIASNHRWMYNKVPRNVMLYVAYKAIYDLVYDKRRNFDVYHINQFAESTDKGLLKYFEDNKFPISDTLRDIAHIYPADPMVNIHDMISYAVCKNTFANRIYYIGNDSVTDRIINEMTKFKSGDHFTIDDQLHCHERIKFIRKANKNVYKILSEIKAPCNGVIYYDRIPHWDSMLTAEISAAKLLNDNVFDVIVYVKGDNITLYSKKGGVDVSTIATKFGGGGYRHKALMHMPFEHYVIE